jgi:hypothetical protein
MGDVHVAERPNPVFTSNGKPTYAYACSAEPLTELTAPWAEESKEVLCIPTGDVVCNNGMDFEGAPTVHILKEDHEFLLDACETLHKTKEKRAAVARRYFEKHRDECYARQKRWREHAKERINAQRREVYRLRKEAAASCAPPVPGHAVPVAHLHTPLMGG